MGLCRTSGRPWEIPRELSLGEGEKGKMIMIAGLKCEEGKVWTNHFGVSLGNEGLI